MVARVFMARGHLQLRRSVRDWLAEHPRFRISFMDVSSNQTGHYVTLLGEEGGEPVSYQFDLIFLNGGLFSDKSEALERSINDLLDEGGRVAAYAQSGNDYGHLVAVLTEG